MTVHRGRRQLALLSLGSALVLSCASVVSAADAPSCKDTETEANCLTRLTTPPDASAVKAASTASSDAAVTDSQSATSGATQGKAFSSALTLFAHTLTGALDAVNVQQTASQLTLETPAMSAPYFEGKLQGIIHQPVLAPNLTTDGTALAALKNQLGDFDDVSVNLQIGAFGAHLSRSSRKVLDALFKAVHARPSTYPLYDNLQGALAKIDEGPNPIGEKQTWGDYKASHPADYQDAMGAVKATVDAWAALDKHVQDDMTRYGFDHISDLLANQSQLVVTVGYRPRNALVGANSLSIKASYEWGMISFEDFVKTGTTCASPDSTDDACLKAFGDWITPLKGKLTQDRLAISLEYLNTESYALSEPLYAINVSTPNTHSLVGSLKYGRMLSSGGAKAGVRLDLSASYENVSSQSTGATALVKESRFVATASLSIRISDALQIPIGVIYANKPEYLGDVDKKWGTHLGLTFRSQ